MTNNASGPNAEQIEFWNSSAADAWVADQERLDLMLAPLSAEAVKAARVTEGERVLDVGCGCGDSSIQIADLGASVVGVDISAPMLARARERVQGREDVTFLQADAATHRFSAEFDLIFSRFGVMFFDDAEAAFANVRSALKPAGRVCFICWQDASLNYWMTTPMSAVAPFVPPMEEPVQPNAPGPFAFADRGYVDKMLESAGYREISITPYIPKMRLGTDLDGALEFFIRVGPLSRTLNDLSDETRVEALDAIREALAPYASDDGITLDGACWIVTAAA